MKTGTKGIELIKNFEGLRLESYLDSVSILTIGFGHTRNVQKGATVTLDQAEILLKEDLRPCELLLNTLMIPFTQNQFDACVSFIFNLGAGNFKNSTLLKKIKVNPNDPSIADEFRRWDKAGGKVLAGLTARRQQEVALYFS